MLNEHVCVCVAGACDNSFGKRAGFNFGRFHLEVGKESGCPRAHEFLTDFNFAPTIEPRNAYMITHVATNSCANVGLFTAARYAALQLASGCLGLIAPDCPSWASQRAIMENVTINALGVGRPFMVDGNCMACKKLGHASKHARMK